MKEWLTVKEAAAIVGRHPRNVYRWIEKGILSCREASDGTIEIRSRDALRVESVVKRGRPKGSVSSRYQ